MSTNGNVPQPLSSAERVDSLDLLRGFAVLGILLMNIQSFAMPGAAYINPTAYGDLQGVNLLVWSLSHVFADQKFMSLFSILFGAGVCVFTERAEANGGRSAGAHYRRNVWLLLFGLAHAHLLWYGDILYSYAICAFVLYFFRRRSPRTLFIAGAMFLLVPVIYNGLMQAGLPHFPSEAIAEINKSWAPSATQLQAEIAGYQGAWSEQQPFRGETAVMLETFVFATHFFWRTMGMMLLGMGLFKLGFLHATRSSGDYRRLVLVGLALGVPLAAWGVQFNFSHGWTLQSSMFGGTLFNYFASILVAIGYIGLVMLWFRSNVLAGLQTRLRAAGRMAFSNYIMQTLICTFVFYGHGLGLYGQFDRWQQVCIVLAIWALQLLYSPLWLARFRFGPLEWLWRSLSYLKLQPMRRASAA